MNVEQYIIPGKHSGFHLGVHFPHSLGHFAVSSENSYVQNGAVTFHDSPYRSAIFATFVWDGPVKKGIDLPKNI